jgi:hypothetical protein
MPNILLSAHISNEFFVFCWHHAKILVFEFELKWSETTTTTKNASNYRRKKFKKFLESAARKKTEFNTFFFNFFIFVFRIQINIHCLCIDIKVIHDSK